MIREINKDIDNILVGCGFISLLPLLINEIEDIVEVENEAIDDEEDDAITPSYGGTVSTMYYLLDEDEFLPKADKMLTEEQKKSLRGLVLDGELHIHASRTDYFKHFYDFLLYIPVVPNKPSSERLRVDIEIETSLFAAEDYKIRATIEKDLDDNALEKMFFMYTLAY